MTAKSSRTMNRPDHTGDDSTVTSTNKREHECVRDLPVTLNVRVSRERRKTTRTLMLGSTVKPLNGGFVHSAVISVPPENYADAKRD